MRVGEEAPSFPPLRLHPLRRRSLVDPRALSWFLSQPLEKKTLVPLSRMGEA